MTRLLSVLAFATGLMVILSMSGSIIADDRLTLLVMVLIAVAYLVGAGELLLYQRDTRGLASALTQIPNALPKEHQPADSLTLDDWLAGVPESLRHAARARIVGASSALPAPTLSPYLVGLLVMLGLMGTFVGMVATLSGAVQALEGGTELSAIRQGLAAPIQGLGMAFGTSVAGVAASAMLGLIATLSRRERAEVAQALVGHRDGYFKAYSLVSQREETYSALRQQADALPAVVDTLASLSAQLGELGVRVGDSTERTSEQLLARQQDFERGVREDFRQLTASVASSLQASLTNAGEQAAALLQPQVTALLEQSAAQFVQASERHAQTLADLHMTLLSQHESHASQQQAAEQAWRTQMEQGAQQLSASVTSELKSLALLEQQRGDTVADQLAQLVSRLEQQLSELQSGVETQWQVTHSTFSEQWRETQRSLSEQWTESQRALLVQLSDGQTALLKQSGDTQDLLSGQLQALQAAVGQQWENMQQAVANQWDETQQTLSQQWQSTQEHVSAQWQKAHDEWVAQWKESCSALSQQWQSSTAALSQQWQVVHGEVTQQWRDVQNDNVHQWGESQQHLSQLLQQIGTTFDSSLSELIEASAATARANAALLEQLNAQTAEHRERENSLLSERRQILEEITELSEALRNSASLQQQIMEQVLEQSGENLIELGNSVGEKLSQSGEQLSGAAQELTTLSNTFAEAVAAFATSSDDIQSALASVSAAMATAGERSDEQMGYYVAQAREIIDHNLLTQQAILERLEIAASGAASA